MWAPFAPVLAPQRESPALCPELFDISPERLEPALTGIGQLEHVARRPQIALHDQCLRHVHPEAPGEMVVAASGQPQALRGAPGRKRADARRVCDALKSFERLRYLRTREAVVALSSRRFTGDEALTREPGMHERREAPQYFPDVARKTVA